MWNNISSYDSTPHLTYSDVDGNTIIVQFKSHYNKSLQLYIHYTSHTNNIGYYKIQDGSILKH